MAAKAPISNVGDVKENVDEAEEKLLEGNQTVIVPRTEDGLALTGKSSKKVKLPEDERVGGRFTIGPAPERDWEMVPPDGKWGWCVLVGATLVNILIPGTIKTFGVLLVEFNDVFGASASATSTIVALCYFLYSSLGPVSSILSVKWSYRTVTLIGGSFAAFGMIFSTFAQSVTYLYFSFGVMVGTGAGLAFPPTVYIVTSYFVRLRGLANGICMSGSAFGSIILPPVLRYLLDTYTYKGTVLILGGIMLNVYAAALLFQPVEEHMVKKYKEPEEEEEQNQLTPFAEEDQVVIEEETNPKLVLTPELHTLDHKPNGTANIIKNNSNVNLDEVTVSNDIIRSISAAQFSNSKEDRLRKISTPTQSRHGLQHAGSRISNLLPSNPSLVLETVPESKTRRNNSQEGFGKKLAVPKTPKRSPSTSSFQYMSTPFHGSTLSAFEKPSEFASQFSLKSVTDSLAPIKYCCFRKNRSEATKKEPSKYFDLQLLKDPIYLVILISNCTCAISYTNFIILVPSYAQELGFDKSLGAYLLSIISALDLVGRIGGSALSDIVTTPKRYFFITGLLLSGLSLAAIPMVSTYLSISIFCSIFGIASGINVGVTALVMTEMLGTERLMSSYGISLFMNGILQLVGPPICGLWFQFTRSYKSLFVTLGLILICGAGLWGFIPIIHRRRHRKMEAEENKG